MAPQPWPHKSWPKRQVSYTLFVTSVKRLGEVNEVLWCSLECTPACQAGGRGFKSRQDRAGPLELGPTGRVAQLVERAPEKREVTGSTPVPTTVRFQVRGAPVNAPLWSADSVPPTCPTGRWPTYASTRSDVKTHACGRRTLVMCPRGQEEKVKKGKPRRCNHDAADDPRRDAIAGLSGESWASVTTSRHRATGGPWAGEN